MYKKGFSASYNLPIILIIASLKLKLYTLGYEYLYLRRDIKYLVF